MKFALRPAMVTEPVAMASSPTTRAVISSLSSQSPARYSAAASPSTVVMVSVPAPALSLPTSRNPACPLREQALVRRICSSLVTAVPFSSTTARRTMAEPPKDRSPELRPSWPSTKVVPVNEPSRSPTLAISMPSVAVTVPAGLSTVTVTVSAPSTSPPRSSSSATPSSSVSAWPFSGEISAKSALTATTAPTTGGLLRRSSSTVTSSVPGKLALMVLVGLPSGSCSARSTV